MKMTRAFLAETVEHLAERGLGAQSRQVSYGSSEEAMGTQYELSARDVQLVIEIVEHVDAEDRFFLEIANFHGMRSTSFPLDSWRYFDDRIEFKYYANTETGMGLSFVLALPVGG